MEEEPSPVTVKNRERGIRTELSFRIKVTNIRLRSSSSLKYRENE